MCPQPIAACCVGRRRKSSARSSKRVAVFPLLLVVTASQLRELGANWGHIARLEHRKQSADTNLPCCLKLNFSAHACQRQTHCTCVQTAFVAQDRIPNDTQTQNIHPFVVVCSNLSNSPCVMITLDTWLLSVSADALLSCHLLGYLSLKTKLLPSFTVQIGSTISEPALDGRTNRQSFAVKSGAVFDVQDIASEALISKMKTTSNGSTTRICS